MQINPSRGGGEGWDLNAPLVADNTDDQDDPERSQSVESRPLSDLVECQEGQRVHRP